MLANGATTLWERWENMTGSEMNSHNHPMMGSVSSWFFKYLAGIDATEKAPGFQEILIRPCFLENLYWVEAEYESLYGTIRSSWKRSNTALELEVTVPVNAHATVHLPANPGSCIAESGQQLDRAEGVETVRHESGMFMVRISSGSYRFRIS